MESKNVKKRNRKKKNKQANASHQAESSIPKPKPLEVLKLELAKAKEAEDHKLAGQLRQDIWVLQDTEAGVELFVNEDELAESMERNTARFNEPTTPVPDYSKSIPQDKSLKKLEKKLEQIQQLKERHKDGEKLEKTQIAKIERENEVKAELEDYLNQLAEISR